MEPDQDVDDLLRTWEAVYKKGLLSFWMLLLLHERAAYPFEMNPLIQDLSQGTIAADDNSLYRALSRFEQLGIVTSELTPSPQGPARRYYSLTGKGACLLGRFIQRNLTVFQNPKILSKLQSVLSELDPEVEP